MRIELNDGMFLEGRDLDWALKQKYVVKEKDSKHYGKERERTLGYGSEATLIKLLMNKEVRQCHIDDVEQVLKHIDTKCTEILDKIKQVKES